MQRPAHIKPAQFKDKIMTLLEMMLSDDRKDHNPSAKQKIILEKCINTVREKISDTDNDNMELVFNLAVAAIAQREVKSYTTYTTGIGKKLKEVLNTDQFQDVKKYFFDDSNNPVTYRKLRHFGYQFYDPNSNPTQQFLKQFFSSENQTFFEKKKDKFELMSEVLDRVTPKEILNLNQKEESNIVAKVQPDEKKLEAKQVLHLSFDFDGCLAFNFLGRIPQDFSSHDNKYKHDFIVNQAKEIANKILEDNLHLLNTIATNAKQYDKIRISIGSNRQSFYRDLVNALKGMGSCYPVFDLINQHLKNALPNVDIAIDKSSLSDSYWVSPDAKVDINVESDKGESGMGEEYTRSQYVKGSANVHDKYIQIQTDKKRDDPEWLFDHTKVSILYQQMQRVRAKNPKAENIDFYFYDDKENDILNPLFEFFNKNPTFIPKGVTLHLNQYGIAYDKNNNFIPPSKDEKSGQLIPSYKPMPVIKGTGIPDPNYKNTVVALGALTLGHSIQGMNDKEIRKSFFSAKRTVYASAQHSWSIGLNSAPDVKNSIKAGKQCGAYSPDHLRKAIMLSARVEAGKVKSLNKDKKMQVAQARESKQVRYPTEVSYRQTSSQRFGFAKHGAADNKRFEQPKPLLDSGPPKKRNLS